MGVELSHLLLAMVITVALLSLVYFLDRLRRPAAVSGRYWAVVFVSAVLCTSAYFVASRTDDAWWAVAVGNSAMVFTIAAVWMGCRAFNRRRTFLLVVCVACAIVAVTSSLPSELGSKWAGASEKMLALAAFSVLVVVECLRPRLRTFGAAWVLAAVLAVHSVYVLARSVAFLLRGPDDAAFSRWFGTEATTVINLVLVVLATIAIVALRFQEAQRSASRLGSDGRVLRVAGRRAFDRAAASAWRPGTTVVVGTVDLISGLRGAYGRSYAAEANSALGRALLDQLPDDATVGAAHGDRVVAILPSLSVAEAERPCAEARNQYAIRMRASDDRTSVSFGIAVSTASLDSAISAASAALQHGAESSSGRISTAS